MKIYSLDDFYKTTENSYEAVHLASKLARKLNDKARSEGEESQTEPATPAERAKEKITSIALEAVVNGEVKFLRGKDIDRRR
jgi:DNA-directed RNA polymerase omega subunit